MKDRTSNDVNHNDRTIKDETADAATPNTEETTEGLLSMDDFKLPQNFDQGISKSVQPVIALKKPDKHWFVRTHPEHRVELGFIELREEGEGRELSLVHRSIWPKLIDEPTFKRKWLFLAKSSHGVLFLWPVNAPRNDGRPDSWTDSHLEAAGRAREVWIRVYADMAARQYVWREAVADMPEPEWPEEDFESVVLKAAKGRIIDREDHPTLRKLWGLE